jgi:hypothetical protein
LSEAWSRAAAGDREEGDGALSAEKEKRAALLPEVGGEPARFCCCWCTLPPGVAALEEVVVAVMVLVGAEVEVSIIVSRVLIIGERSGKSERFDEEEGK